MRLAVAGGTGRVGRLVVKAARDAGHVTTVISRRNGVDLRSGAGLGNALTGVDAVIDVTDHQTTRASTSIAFFEAATRNLLAAEHRTGVTHHVALSIAGIDRVPFGYYEGKLTQEALIARDSVPWTVLRASQFHEFPDQLLSRTKGPVVVIPRMRSSTVAISEVAARLVELATSAARGLAPEFGGPEVNEMPDLTRRLLRARSSRRWILPLRIPGETGRQMAGGGLVATGDGPRGRQTFDQWLAELATGRA